MADDRIGLIMRDICELDADDPEDVQTICINIDMLERIIRESIDPVACEDLATLARWHQAQAAECHRKLGGGP